MINYCHADKIKAKDEKMILPKAKNSKNVFYLGENFPNVYFTTRENQCMSFFIKGYTNDEVAIFLALSRRTVEEYLDNMKKKLNCASKKVLIRKVLCSDLVKIIFSDKNS